MDRELEIRAVKALGGLEIGHGNMVSLPDIIAKKFNLDVHIWFHTEDLKFTTSYDWAMLLVKECFATPRTHAEFIGKFRSITHFLVAPIAQITQVAVEVLEINNG